MTFYLHVHWPATKNTYPCRIATHTTALLDTSPSTSGKTWWDCDRGVRPPVDGRLLRPRVAAEPFRPHHFCGSLQQHQALYPAARRATPGNTCKPWCRPYSRVWVSLWIIHMIALVRCVTRDKGRGNRRGTFARKFPRYDIMGNDSVAVSLAQPSTTTP